MSSKKTKCPGSGKMKSTSPEWEEKKHVRGGTAMACPDCGGQYDSPQGRITFRHHYAGGRTTYVPPTL